jgi:4-amino-4-deoxy-L-arabinose transferase-like glycosyltransferase
VKIPKKYIAAIVVTLFVSAGLKIWLMVKGVIPFNSDEAIVGLMARHILMGERPVFFYGQAYMGSLDAYLVAFGFSLLGQSIWVIRLVQILLYLGTIITTLWIGVTFFKSYRTGLYSIILLAVPSVTVTLYTTASLGGYGEALLIGNLILASGFWLIREFNLKPENKSRRIYGIAFFYGLMVGLGIWANGLTLVYSIPTSIFLFFSYVRVVSRSKIHRRQPLPG